jgi:hypothetical protein
VNIAIREGHILPIEERMLQSIANHISASGLSEVEIAETKKLPDLATMVIGLGYERLFYTVAQRLGSHHVHGTWPSLLSHYLEERDDQQPFSFVPRGHDCETHINQYMFVSRVVLSSLAAYVKYAFNPDEDVDPLLGLLKRTQDNIMSVYAEATEAEDRRRAL